jgi:molybdopterin/thiamine biosynthesis adenylyltransferase
MSIELDRLADRHFRRDPQGVLADAADTREGIVLVRMSTAIAGAVAAQHLVWMLVNLLSRQFKVVKEIVLDIPEVALHSDVAPFGIRPHLVDALEECVRLVSGPHVKASRATADIRPDITLLLGEGGEASPPQLHLYADGWRFFVGADGKAPSRVPVCGLSIGPYLCASYAAGEVFKVLRGMKPGKGEFIRSHFGSAWTMSCAETWEELVDGPDTSQFGALPHFYFAGAGAVAQAAALCLSSSGFHGSCTTVDKDTVDLTNDNRYPLSTREDDGRSKVALMKDYLTARGFGCQPVPDWWEAFAVSAGKNAPDASVRALERNYKFAVVLSCVDKNAPRHALQNAVPQLVIGGSTDGLTAKASIFDLGIGTACLKCHNPLRSRNEIVSERIEKLKQLHGEERAAFMRDVGLNEADVQLLLSPGGCGKLSEADIDRFASGAPEMSVGFVSVAAGVLLTAQFLRYIALGAARATEGGAMALATFARAKVRLMNVGCDQACDCDPSLRQRWKASCSRSYRD